MAVTLNGTVVGDMKLCPSVGLFSVMVGGLFGKSVIETGAVAVVAFPTSHACATKE
jgi:hypothetical protein